MNGYAVAVVAGGGGLVLLVVVLLAVRPALRRLQNALAALRCGVAEDRAPLDEAVHELAQRRLTRQG